MSVCSPYEKGYYFKDMEGKKNSSNENEYALHTFYSEKKNTKNTSTDDELQANLAKCQTK